MSKQMLKKEHTYFHRIIFVLQRIAEPKFTRGCVEHRSKKMLWEFTDAELDAAIDEELTDLMMYQGEKWRRQMEGPYEP